MLLFIFSPLIVCGDLNVYRQKLFCYITFSLEILSIISILLLITGLGSGGGVVSGPYNHSMVAVPFFSITTLHFISDYQLKKRKIIILAALNSLFFTIYSASRISIFGLIFSIVIYYLFFYRKSIPKAIGISILLILILILILYVSRMLFPSMFINIDKKMNSRTFYDSRRYYLINQRIYEYKNSPIIGVGFGNTLFEETLNSHDGRVEPGSSWLFILSSIGTLGFISFLFIYIKSFYLCLKETNVYDSSLLISILTFYGVHMCMEGYILASGNPLTIYFWLLISQIYSQQQNLKKQCRINQNCNTLIYD